MRDVYNYLYNPMIMYLCACNRDVISVTFLVLHENNTSCNYINIKEWRVLQWFSMESQYQCVCVTGTHVKRMNAKRFFGNIKLQWVQFLCLCLLMFILFSVEITSTSCGVNSSAGIIMVTSKDHFDIVSLSGFIYQKIQ